MQIEFKFHRDFVVATQPLPSEKEEHTKLLTAISDRCDSIAVNLLDFLDPARDDPEQTYVSGLIQRPITVPNFWKHTLRERSLTELQVAFAPSREQPIPPKNIGLTGCHITDEKADIEFILPDCRVYDLTFSFNLHHDPFYHAAIEKLPGFQNLRQTCQKIGGIDTGIMIAPEDPEMENPTPQDQRPYVIVGSKNKTGISEIIERYEMSGAVN